MNNIEHKKEIVPIMSGDVKYIGLTVPEWILNSVIFCGYYILLNKEIGFSKWYVFCIIHIFGIVFYGAFIVKIEENIVYVIKNNFKIPSIIFGNLSRPIPIEKSRAEILGGKSSND